ncbi:MAG: hypothetical protein S0880_12660 [Actinomycetota bacterium]|nr:hypothetical protein [Actinomycetota bacterium]
MATIPLPSALDARELHGSPPIDVGPNEASGLAVAEHAPLLDALGVGEAAWSVLDEAHAQRSVVLLTNEGDGFWDGRVLDPGDGDWPKTEDSEAIARHGDWLYVVGSQHGSKDGPLQRKRSFVARFAESSVEVRDDGSVGLPVPMQVARKPFVLHRLVNDALAEFGVRLLDPGPKVRKPFVHKARKKANHKGRSYGWRIHWDDVPINVEGAVFRDDDLMIGLRTPVTADGDPIVVTIRGIERLFTGLGTPEIADVMVVRGAGSQEAPVGVRDLHLEPGDALHVITGNLDSSPDRSLMLKALPEGGRAHSAHWWADLTTIAEPAARGGIRTLHATVEAQPVREFPDRKLVEGLCRIGDRFAYAADDEEHVRVLEVDA